MYDITTSYEWHNILRNISVIIIPEWCEDENTPYVGSGPIHENYVFSRIHFHWGSAINGSEHTVDGIRYHFRFILFNIVTLKRTIIYRMPLEMHAIHYKKEYNQIERAKKYDDGLLFLVYFLEV